MFSEQLKKLRHNQGLSQRELAKQLFVSQQTVAKWEMDRATPNPDTLSKISDIFNVTSDCLLGREETKKIRPSEDERILDELLRDPELKEIYDKLTALTPENRELAHAFLETLASHQEKHEF